MLKNYFKIAIRNITRYKVYSFINIFGLAIGIAVCVLIFLFISDELSYDRFHTKSERIYRVSRSWTNADGEVSLHLGHVAPPFAPLLANDFPDVVENAVRMLSTDNELLSNGEKKIVEQKIFFVDKDFFNVFSFDLLEGDPKAALSEPNSIVLTKEAAKRYFGEENPIGKSLRFNDDADLKVTGIVEDAPANSHFQFNVLISFLTVEDFVGRENLMSQWGNNSFSTYLVLKENYDPKELEAVFPGFIDKHIGDYNGVSASEGTQLHLWPITDIHLYSNLDSEIEPNGNIEYIYIYGAIGIFILLIACINFMNLATARSGRRAKEVGLRKTMGAVRNSLVKQFISESFLITAFALVLSLILVVLVLPSLSIFIEKELSLNILQNPLNIMVIICLAIIVGLLAGSYPAFYLSSFNPSAVLKGAHKAGRKQQFFRGSLVVLQFSISIVLIVGMIIVYQQLDYVKYKPLGFEKENLILLSGSEEISSKYESLREQFLKQPGILNVTHASRVPSGRLLDSQGAKVEIDGKMEEVNFRIADVSVDHDYLKTFGMTLVAGRDFNRDLTSDSTESFIINESAVYTIGYTSPEEAIGKSYHYGEQKGNIIGVVKNFHFETLPQPISPIVLMVGGNARSIVVRFEESRRAETIAYLQTQWEYLRPDFPFTYATIEDKFLEQYKSEEKLGQLIGYFAVIAIIIASLGLLGLASFTTEQRTREIGVRKVLGASISEILMLLLKGFSKWVVVAFIIACPLAYFGMDKWLQNFAYHNEISVIPFIAGGVFALLLAWLTVGFLSVKASLANPVDSLRSE